MKKKYIIIIVLLLIAIPVSLFLLFNSKSTKSYLIDEKVEQDSEFIYHIEVSNKYINSYDIIEGLNVEDVLPNGLTFVGFLPSKAYGIGSSTSCAFNAESPSYNEDSRKISFKINYLPNNCTFRLGVIVKSGTTNSRTDYYNTATVKYDGKLFDSNIVHTFIGDDEAERYNVSYSVSGTNETNVTPQTKKYTVGQEVSLEPAKELKGYSFNEWTSNDVTITDGKFIMPNHDVTIIGIYTFLNLPKHKVIYEVSGIKPNDFTLPITKEYYEGEEVYILPPDLRDDLSTKIYDDAYYFADLKLSNNVEDDFTNNFVMPNSDVTITLKFDKVPYIIGYKFEGSLAPEEIELPPSTTESNILYYDSPYLYILPNNVEYWGDNPYEESESYAGFSAHYFEDKVNINKDYKSTICYDQETGRYVKCRFLGWLYNDEFNMPNHHLTIKGTWMEINGTFEPDIKVEITNPKEYYEKGEVIEFKTTIKNTSDVEIKNLIIDNNLKDQVIVPSENYTLEDGYVKIRKMDSNESVVILSSYTVGENVTRNFVNEFEILSAEADNEYYLENEEYKSSVNFNSKKTGDSTPVNNDTNNTNTTNDTVIEKNETIPKDTNNTPNNESTVPKTSDNAYIYILLLVGSLILIIAIVIVFIKNKKNK